MVFHGARSVRGERFSGKTMYVALASQLCLVTRLCRRAGTSDGVPKLGLFLYGFGHGVRSVTPKHFTACRSLGFNFINLFSQAVVEVIQVLNLTSRKRGGIQPQ